MTDNIRRALLGPIAERIRRYGKTVIITADAGRIKEEGHDLRAVDYVVISDQGRVSEDDRVWMEYHNTYGEVYMGASAHPELVPVFNDLADPEWTLLPTVIIIGGGEDGEDIGMELPEFLSTIYQ